MNPDDILYHITIATKPTELIQTTHGLVTYEQWVEAERMRILKKNDWPLAVYVNERTGEMSLVHLRVKPKT